VNGLRLTKLKQVFDPRGAVYHALKASDSDYCGFGEIYFSKINRGIVKGWKRHNTMTMNLTVPMGKIKIVAYDGIGFADYLLGSDNYYRLTVAPGYWVAFMGISENNLLANIANIEHDDNEISSKSLDDINYDWG